MLGEPLNAASMHLHNVMLAFHIHHRSGSSQHCTMHKTQMCWMLMQMHIKRLLYIPESI